jgi:hypothetical protein
MLPVLLLGGAALALLVLSGKSSGSTKPAPRPGVIPPESLPAPSERIPMDPITGEEPELYRPRLVLEAPPEVTAHYAAIVADPTGYTLGEIRAFVAMLTERAYAFEADQLATVAELVYQQHCATPSADPAVRAFAAAFCQAGAGRFEGGAIPAAPVGRPAAPVLAAQAPAAQAPAAQAPAAPPFVPNAQRLEQLAAAAMSGGQAEQDAYFAELARQEGGGPVDPTTAPATEEQIAEGDELGVNVRGKTQFAAGRTIGGARASRAAEQASERAAAERAEQQRAAEARGAAAAEAQRAAKQTAKHAAAAEASRKRNATAVKAAEADAARRAKQAAAAEASRKRNATAVKAAEADAARRAKLEAAAAAATAAATKTPAPAPSAPAAGRSPRWSPDPSNPFATPGAR